MSRVHLRAYHNMYLHQTLAIDDSLIRRTDGRTDPNQKLLNHSYNKKAYKKHRTVYYNFSVQHLTAPVFMQRFFMSISIRKSLPEKKKSIQIFYDDLSRRPTFTFFLLAFMRSRLCSRSPSTDPSSDSPFYSISFISLPYTIYYYVCLRDLSTHYVLSQVQYFSIKSFR